MARTRYRDSIHYFETFHHWILAPSRWAGTTNAPSRTLQCPQTRPSSPSRPHFSIVSLSCYRYRTLVRTHYPFLPPRRGDRGPVDRATGMATGRPDMRPEPRTSKDEPRRAERSCSSIGIPRTQTERTRGRAGSALRHHDHQRRPSDPATTPCTHALLDTAPRQRWRPVQL